MISPKLWTQKGASRLTESLAQLHVISWWCILQRFWRVFMLLFHDLMSLFLIDMLFPDLNISAWLCMSAFRCSARLPQRLLLLVLHLPLYLPWFFKTIRFCSTSSLWSSFSVWQSLKFWSYLWVAHPISLHLICDKLLNEDQYAFSPAAPTFCSPPSLQN